MMHRAIVLLLVVAGLVSTFGEPVRASATVSSLWTDQVCAGDGTVTARLTWGPINASATDQWLDLAWRDPYTELSLVQTSRRLAGGANTIEWLGLTPGLTYQVQVTQHFAVDLIAVSPILSFKTAPCSSTVPGEIVSIRPTPVPTAPPSASSAPDDDTADTGDTDDTESPSDSSQSGPRKASDYIGRSDPPQDFCTFAACIDNFWNGRGTVVRCADGKYSKSGGIRGSCSGHGGNS